MPCYTLIDGKRREEIVRGRLWEEDCVHPALIQLGSFVGTLDPTQRSFRELAVMSKKETRGKISRLELQKSYGTSSDEQKQERDDSRRAHPQF